MAKEKDSMKKHKVNQPTDYEKALLFVIESTASAQLRFNLRLYQIYELLKEAKIRIKHQGYFKDAFLEREKFIIEQENFKIIVKEKSREK